MSPGNRTSHCIRPECCPFAVPGRHIPFTVLFVRVTGEIPPRCSFEDYKKNEKKEVKVDEILGADVARKAVSDAMVSTCSMCLMCMQSVHIAAPGQADIHRKAPI